MTTPAFHEPAGSAFVAIDMPGDERQQNAHLGRIVRLLQGWGYNATVLTGQQVMEAGLAIAAKVQAEQQIADQAQRREEDNA